MEDLATITESSLFSKLQSSSDLSSIHHLFSSYLQPFNAITNKPKKQSKSPITDAEASTVIYSLAGKFNSFLNKALNIIPKRLNETPKIESCYASQLFEAYKLCLSCLESVLSALSYKPLYIQFQRLRLIHCYEDWGRYEDAQNEGFSVLEYIVNLSGERGGNLNQGFLPELRKENVDKDFAVLILDVVASQANCVLNIRSKDEEDYRRLLSMVDEIQPWLRFVDKCTYEKMHKLLVGRLTKCTLFLVEELASFDRSLVQSFCVLTLSEYTKPTMHDQMEKFGRMVCNSVFSHKLLCSVDILTCVLDSLAQECKNGKEKSIVDFLKAVDHCAIKCLNATVEFCGKVATHLNKLAAKFSQVNFLPVDFITRLYAIALPLSYLNSYSNVEKKKAGKDVSVLKVLLNLENQLQNLTARLGSLTSQCKISERTYVPFWFTALKFLCGPLSKVVIIEHKVILEEVDSFSTKLPNIQDAFHQFVTVFLAYRSSTYERERERDAYDQENNMKVVLNVAEAAIRLSFATKENVKESTSFLMHLISADWVKANELKRIIPCLHNLGVMLYTINRLKEAVKSLKLCRQAAWKRVSIFCKSGLSLDANAISGFVTDACFESASLLELLHLYCGNRCSSNTNKISKIFTDSLGSWYVAHNLFGNNIPHPKVLIAQWAKIQCEQVKDAGNTIPTIYSLMSPYKMSKEAFGILLEEELQAYKQVKYLNPTLCKTMRMTIINILLDDIYTTKDSCLQRSKILITKGRESRACDIEGLNDCIKYLSEAISIMNDYESKNGSGPVCHLLAEAYCLHALCTQEAEPNSKHIIEDVGNALKLWMNQEHSGSAEQTRNTLTLLHYVADLLSLKGFMEHHSDIYKTMIRFFTQKNIPLQKCLTMLWHSRSLTHALCGSPVSDAFIRTFSNHCSLSKSLDFWITCMERSKSLQVGFRQSFSVIPTLSTPDSYKHNDLIIIHEVKQAASDLINSVPLSDNSLFLSAQLYYDLGEPLISRGSMIEALYYAKEAHSLRTNLLEKNFNWLIEPQNDIVETIQNHTYGFKIFHIIPAMATAAWPYDDKGSCDFKDCILTPWNVLKVYLESILQVATIQEIVGNGSGAKTLLLSGKNISCLQDLPIFVVAFSCALGKLYREQRLWDLAERELESAKHILADSSSLISCLKCRLVLEVTVDQQLGDLFQSRFSDDKLLSGLSKAEAFYRSATEKLNVSEWKNCVSESEEPSGTNTMLCDAVLVSGQETIQPKVTRKRKKTAKNLTEQRVTSRMVTRSCKQYAQNEVIKEKFDCIATCGCEDSCASYKVKCWHCLPSEIMKSNSLTSIIQMKWECIRRRLLLRLLTGIGKCLGVGGEVKSAHEVLLEGIFVLFSRNTFRASNLNCLLLAELIERNVTADVFAVDHASILYNICWFSLGTRNIVGCDTSVIPIPILVSGLKLSFILCREVPVLFQKVSRLLAVLYTLSPSNKAFSMLSSSTSNVVNVSQWASYFHQASLGTHYNHQMFFRIRKHNTMDVDDSSIPIRLAPESISDLEEFISKFFGGGLPCLTIICISMFGDDFVSLLKELLPNEYNHPTYAWIMLSRLNSDSLPIVILLPINSIIAGSSEEDKNSNSMSCHKLWRCPWGHTIIDDVAPFFKRILEKHHISINVKPLDNTKRDASLWRNERRKFDQWLGDLVRDVENLWFGPWKHVLLGEPCLDNNKHFEIVQKKLMNDLKSECKVDVQESIIKLITGHATCQDEWSSELFLKTGCYVGGTSMAYSSKQDKFNNLSKMISDAIQEIGEENDLVDRGPVILVLDFDIQMLPWENLPVLRNQEVYRMPSVAGISSTFDRCCQYDQEKDSTAFPMIDPLDAYYLINPDGDLPKTEAVFKNWFKDQNLEGMTGSSPSVDELSLALKDHDLFIYFGHGSGVQYIPGDKIQKLDGCAAILLMGCRSGSIKLNGPYIPTGAPLYYLSAGSPVIVANLWEVTVKDINRFGEALVDAWIRRRSNCTDNSKKMNIDDDGDERKVKRKTSKKKPIESCEVNNCTNGSRIGSFMGQAREACNLPFLTGASPVCYGVPTGIRNRDL